MAISEAPRPGVESPAVGRTRSDVSGFVRVLQYSAVKLVSIAVAVVIAVYLTILVANMGGYVDQMRIATIKENVGMWVYQAEEFRHLSGAEKRELIDQFAQVQIQALRLDQPFPIRSLRYLWNGLTLNLGYAEQITSDSGSRQVQHILLERLGPTLLLQASASILVFVTALFMGLALSRGYGSFLDRLVVALAPTSSAPAWFYGVFLILIFAALLGWLPFGGMVDAPPPPNKFQYFLSVLKHLILPVAAVFTSTIFASIFSQRTFFLIYSSEDYVEMAKAKGLSDRAIERRYILRPTLPTIITSIALSFITLWVGNVTLEQIFNWPGLGQLFWLASRAPDTPVIVANTIIYAYLLAITVFLLDIVYAIVDPRVKVGAEAQSN